MKTKTIGLALGGGGAKGLAHIGVIKVFEKAGFKINYITGTSIGAIIGGLYAATSDIKFIEKIFLYIAKNFSYPRFHFSLHNNILFKNQKEVERIITEPLKNLKVEDLKIPFGAIATNAETGEEVFLKSGNLIEIIKASAALPHIFEPVKIGNQILIDGGYTNPIPVDKLKEMGAQFIIGVNVSHDWPDLSKPQKLNLKNIIKETYGALQFQIANEKTKDAHLIIKPPVLDYKMSDFYYASEIIEKGKNEAEKYISFIRKETNSPRPIKKPLEYFIDFITCSNY